ncbi:MAG: hypothetical protein RL307_926, partial [Pseudomonadota bacterium]
MTISKNRRHTLAVVVTLALAAATPSVMAQTNWPTKPVKIVVPFAPGGT